MSQSHLTIDFPIKGPANARALTEELPPLMPDFAKTQDQLGTVHFSRFMVKGDEKLLFISDIDGETDRISSGSWSVPARCLTPSSNTWTTLRHARGRQPSESDHLAEVSRPRASRYVLRLRGFGSGDQGVALVRPALRAIPRRAPLLTYMSFRSRVQGFVLKLVGPALIGEKGHNALTAVGTVHVSHFVPFENNQLGFFTIFDGSFERYIQDFADKTSFTFNTLFPNIVGGSPTPVEKNAQAFYQWALENNYPPIGFYSAYPGLPFHGQGRREASFHFGHRRRGRPAY